jgi:hypothetical protein
MLAGEVAIIRCGRAVADGRSSAGVIPLIVACFASLLGLFLAPLEELLE